VPALLLSLVLLAGSSAPAMAGAFWDAVSGGKVDLLLRYRYEDVDQEGISNTAKASTLKTLLGYRTGEWNGLAAYVQFEAVSLVGDEKYNDTVNGKSQYPVVADPADAEVNQAYLEFVGLKGHRFRLGRQLIILDNARFVGNVGWRQNMQTFDAFSLQVDPLEKLRVFYAYVENANRIFGEHHPSRSDERMATHLLNVRYAPMAALSVTAYGYFLDFDASPDRAHRDLGLRLAGKVSLGEAASLSYLAEYADQGSYADGADEIDASYMRGQVGLTVKPVSVGVGYELLGGDGTYAFVTPLATLHGFNGWADKFLVTPLDGLEDLFAELGFKLYGVNLRGIYHRFAADNGGYDYGDELDVVLTKGIGKHLVLGAKYADYGADSNPRNSGGPAVDVRKIWAFAQVKI
jgi:hypothetical protein